MRVLAVTNLYPNPVQPHRAPFNRHQFRLLSARCPLRVIAPVPWLLRGCPKQTELDGLTVTHPRYWYPPRLFRWHGPFFRWSVRRDFLRAIDEFRPDIVLAPWAYPDGWAAVKLAHTRGLPAVVQVHGSDVKLLDDYPAKRQPTMEALREADGVIAVSRDLANNAAKLGASRIRVIYDGVDADLFSPRGERQASDRTRPQVLFVGNLVPVKQVDLLLDAMADLDADLTIIGDGPMRKSLEDRANGRTRFLGAMPLAELPRYYHAADLFVLPSRSEGVPNVLLEASACGVPWVASNVGGIPEIAHLGASRLVPPGDVAALRTAIREMLQNPPPPPGIQPRLRTEAVAELQAFLEDVLAAAPKRR